MQDVFAQPPWHPGPVQGPANVNADRTGLTAIVRVDIILKAGAATLGPHVQALLLTACRRNGVQVGAKGC